jgi:hypothetical protein
MSTPSIASQLTSGLTDYAPQYIAVVGAVAVVGVTPLIAKAGWKFVTRLLGH